jgi:hypothetical protein
LRRWEGAHGAALPILYTTPLGTLGKPKSPCWVTAAKHTNVLPKTHSVRLRACVTSPPRVARRAEGSRRASWQGRLGPGMNVLPMPGPSRVGLALIPPGPAGAAGPGRTHPPRFSPMPVANSTYACQRPALPAPRGHQPGPLLVGVVRASAHGPGGPSTGASRTGPSGRSRLSAANAKGARHPRWRESGGLQSERACGPLADREAHQQASGAAGRSRVLGGRQLAADINQGHVSSGS